jgi:glycosyltransferase involved in cell wall biosynthesis
MKIQILVPTHDNIPALFAYDLAQLMAHTTSIMPKGVELGLSFSIGTYVHVSRNELLHDALENGADYVLWLDSDMRFPREMLVALLNRDENVVGINYCTRQVPPTFVAAKGVRTEKGIRVPTMSDSTGLEEVDVIGFGGVLIKTDILKDLPPYSEEPWFHFDRLHNNSRVGEDAYFCLNILQDKLGQKIYVDHDLSRACAHIGSFEYKTDHAELTWEVEQSVEHEDNS